MVLDVFIHECTDLNCKEHNGMFNNAEIRSIRNANRFKSHMRSDNIVDFSKQLEDTEITPRKSSMTDLLRPCKHEESDDAGNKNHSTDLRKVQILSDSAVIHDPAIIDIGFRDAKPTDGGSEHNQNDRFQGLLRKLQRPLQDEQSKHKVARNGDTRPRQVSEDSGIDTRGPHKALTLNPLAREFSTFAPQTSSATSDKAEERDRKTIISLLEQLVSQTFSKAPEQDPNEIIANTIAKFGIQGTQAFPPFNFTTSVPRPTLHPSLFQQTPPVSLSPAFGLQNNIVRPPLDFSTQMPAAPFDPSAPGFTPSLANNATAPPLLPLRSPFNPTRSTLPQHAHGSDTSRVAPAIGFVRQMANSPAVPIAGPWTAPFPTQAPVPRHGSLLNANAPVFGPSMAPRCAAKPRVPDTVGQQSYEAYIEWRKANEPGYALECKARQAKRALRPIPS
ncbi:uncharacterized protein BDZ83DRAFT_746921 [Colletotrichum acutatum]|uniref:Uncharacterized protein n=1 Tax=Glomerella acutata TaxID=27357 RepID=A0AAD8XPI7_GLOAC|nr:uncharacterized protein BDZ83DRAFT_746921 [Colletotrichum acutatum]KAK1731067.1 hypothetical protein BDZ83DRAFT_746921 [Colletotrichum acutatum]